MAVKLNKNEIKQRLIKLRNFGMLHPKVRKKVKLLEQQIKLLKEENTTLKALVAEQKLLIEKLRLRIEELEQMGFGRKKKNNQSNDDLPQSNQSNPLPRKPRDPQSYRRPLPKISKGILIRSALAMIMELTATFLSITSFAGHTPCEN